MLLKRPDQKIRTDEQLRGGKGTVRMELFPTPQEAGGCGRMYCRTILEPGCSIGYHEHHGESESYYIVSGTGIFTDDDKQFPVEPGDFTLCADGHGHAIENTGTEPMVFIALILSAAK